MYTAWFELTDRPFAITPDPRYLYLSEAHREALAHLLYGVTESGGFIQLTGEVGTGKTTLTRALLEQLPEHVDAALVYNAHASLAEFLESICDELGVARAPGTSTPKALTDALNQHLLGAHARGRRTVLIVDEAQNLDAELLEQVRLLTNLETHREKLLQILLIGQPELRDTLARNDLRQLAQRVTARYHLEPLDEAATTAYVRHRLEVAGARRTIFPPSAIRAVHAASGGIPRLVNVICDRAMLGAFAAGAHEVDAGLVRAAAAEVAGARPHAPRGHWLAWAAGVLAVLAVGVFLARPNMTAPETPPPAPVVMPQPAPTPVPEVEPARPLQAMLASDDDLRATTGALLATWGVTTDAELPGALCAVATDNGLACSRGRGTWNNLRVLGRPVLLELRVDGQTRTVLLTGLTSASATLWQAGESFEISLLELDERWLGDYLLLWRPPADPGTSLRTGDRGPAVAWLRDALARWSGDAPSTTGDPGYFDVALADQVREFQFSLGLDVDGVAGERTLAHLDGLTTADGPRLDAGGEDVVDP